MADLWETYQHAIETLVDNGSNAATLPLLQVVIGILGGSVRSSIIDLARTLMYPGATLRRLETRSKTHLSLGLMLWGV